MGHAACARPGWLPVMRHLSADHGSTRWIDTTEGLAEAIDYVVNEQG